MPEALSRIPCRRLTGTETLRGEGVPQGSTIGHFWQWSASDLLGNTSPTSVAAVAEPCPRRPALLCAALQGAQSCSDT